MSENNFQTCPECGGPLETGKPCPSCLLKMVSQPTDTLDDLSIAPETSDAASATPDIEAVQNAFPQLEIIEQIGRGGMGTVFKARQPKLNRFVALKILSPEFSSKEHFAERFLREAQLLARLSHPNIVTVHDFGQSGGFYYLMMEFVDGVNLRQAIRSEHFTPEQTLSIVPKICEALQYAHEEGVLHRDIKPENILLDTRGRIKIADFGIASVARWTANGASAPNGDPLPLVAGAGERLTQTGQILGTPNYMAPEQIERPSEVDHRADIYSLGVVFYELLTGELPLGRFAPPSEKSDTSPNVDRIVLKALEKERERRQQSAVEMKTEIEDLPSGRSELPLDGETRSRWSLADLKSKIAAEIKTWPIWATILVGLALLSIGIPLLISAIVIVVGILVFVYGDMFETLFFGYKFVSPFEFIFGVVLPVVLILFYWFRRRRKRVIADRPEPVEEKAVFPHEKSPPDITEPKRKSIWRRIVAEVKTWPIWATILVVCVAGPMVLYVPVQLLVILVGSILFVADDGLRLHENWPIISPLITPVGLVLLVILGLIIRFYRRKQKKEEAKQYDGKAYVRQLWMAVSSTILAGVGFLYLFTNVLWKETDENLLVPISMIFVILFLIFSVMNILDLHWKSISAKSNRDDKDDPTT